MAGTLDAPGVAGAVEGRGVAAAADAAGVVAGDAAPVARVAVAPPPEAADGAADDTAD